MNVVVLNDMATPEWIINTDGSARHVVNVVVADSVVPSDRHKDTGGLFAINTDVVHEVVGNQAFRRILVDVAEVPRPSRPAEFAVPFTRDHVVLTAQANGTVARKAELVSCYVNAPVVIADEDRVAADRIEEESH